MNKTRIDWADMTWNPVTGCLHGCKYCYARKIAERFGMPQLDRDCHVYSGKVQDYDAAVHAGPYPWGFAPTLHEYRLDDPFKCKRTQTIFVCSMADLFGEWVPDEWIQAVFVACEAAPWHRYLFLTKNPSGTARYDKNFSKNNNWWLGITVTNQKSEYGLTQMSVSANRFISIEPIFEPINLQNRVRRPFADWVIIGAETGNRKGKVIPEKAWIDGIVRKCFEWCVPIFMKESLRQIMGADFVQQYPVEWGHDK